MPSVPWHKPICGVQYAHCVNTSYHHAQIGLCCRHELGYQCNYRIRILVVSTLDFPKSQICRVHKTVHR